MTWQQLVANAALLDPAVAKIAFAFVLVGYGVKIGFAPMHVWKPDTYSKSPAPLGALFSGALLPVAFSLLLRFKLITDTAIGSSFSDMLLMIFGAVSIFVAAFCIFTTHNYKRTLAYSSVEHAGIMALGFSFGGIGAFAAVMHMFYHSLIKPALFFITGNILIKYHSARIAKVSGAMSIIPITTILMFAGLFAVTGLPPFGMFLTEVSIAAAGLQVHPVVTVGAMLLIAIVFIGFFKQISAMALSAEPDDKTIHKGEDSAWLLVSPAILLTLSLIATFYLPPFLLTLINEVATRF
jgi:hydrogenase-4 component F